MDDKVSELAQLKAELEQYRIEAAARADVVTQPELMELLHIDPPTFYRWQKLGKFKQLEIPLGSGVRRRYSRKRVMALLNGEGRRRSA